MTHALMTNDELAAIVGIAKSARVGELTTLQLLNKAGIARSGHN